MHSPIPQTEMPAIAPETGTSTAAGSISGAASARWNDFDHYLGEIV